MKCVNKSIEFIVQAAEADEMTNIQNQFYIPTPEPFVFICVILYVVSGINV
jgi:hypothetical protein